MSTNASLVNSSICSTGPAAKEKETIQAAAEGLLLFSIIIVIGTLTLFKPDEYFAFIFKLFG